MDINKFRSVYEDETVIVLDTNILLALVKYSTYSSSNILKILETCIEKIWIPNQVYKEYIKNKNHEFAKSKKKYENFKKELNNLVKLTNQSFYKIIKESQKLEYPRCDILGEKLQNHINNLTPIINEYIKDLGVEYENTKKEKQVKDLEDFFNELIKCKSIGSPATQNEIINTIKEGELRYKYKIPPGYEDLDEKDGIDVFGDLFIWKEILNYPKENKVFNIIFLTNDLKEDWWVLKGEERLPVNVRPELVKEFNETNPKCGIFFLNLATFQSLTSDYFNLPSYYTYLELNANSYIREKLFPKYSQLIFDELYNYAIQIEPIDFSDEFYKCNDNEVLVEGLEFISSDFLIRDESAIYSIIVNLPVSIYLTYEDNEGDNFPMGEINLNIEASIEISQKILIKDNKLEDDDGYEVSYIVDKDIQIIEPYDYYCEKEADAKAEMYEVLEEYFKH